MWDDLWIDDQFDQLLEKLVTKSHQVYVGHDNKIKPVVFSQEIKTPWIFTKKYQVANVLLSLF